MAVMSSSKEFIVKDYSFLASFPHWLSHVAPTKNTADGGICKYVRRTTMLSLLLAQRTGEYYNKEANIM
jgi:hypothetical protein